MQNHYRSRTKDSEHISSRPNAHRFFHKLTSASSVCSRAWLRLTLSLSSRLSSAMIETCIDAHTPRAVSKPLQDNHCRRYYSSRPRYAAKGVWVYRLWCGSRCDEGSRRRVSHTVGDRTQLSKEKKNWRKQNCRRYRSCLILDGKARN